MSALNRWIKRKIGLVVNKEFEGNIQFALKETATEMNIEIDQLQQGLLSDAIDPQNFIERILTNESFFFRYEQQMKHAAESIIIPLLDRGTTPNVLSLPSANGEEPYSFAMILSSCGVRLDRVNITGIDISTSCIEKAKQGIYNEYAFRRTNTTYRQAYFTKRGDGRYELSPMIRQAVNFQCKNLFYDFNTITKQFDLIFFNNLLIYFDDTYCHRALETVRKLLAPEGCLIVDSTELPRCKVYFSLHSVDNHNILKHPNASKAKARPTASDKKSDFIQRQSDIKGLKKLKTFDKRYNKLKPKTQDSLANHKSNNSVNTAVISKPEADKLHTDKTEALLAQAHQAQLDKAFKKAIEIYQQIPASDQKACLKATAALSRLFADQGEDMRAMELAEQAINQDTAIPDLLSDNDRADLHGIMALGLRARGLHDAAKLEFEAVMALNAQHPVVKLYRPGASP